MGEKIGLDNCAGSCERADLLLKIAELELALLPFARLGEIMLSLDKNDNSVWVKAGDETPVRDVSAYDFRFRHFRNAARLHPFTNKS